MSTKTSDSLSSRSVVVLGGGALGLHTLAVAIDIGLNVIAVVLRRSESARGAAMEIAARELGIRTIRSASTPWDEIKSLLSRSEVDYLISAQYDLIIPSDVFSLARVAGLNVHFGPLPRLRGCFPTKWAIINDESSGVTIHHIDDGVDTGRIVSQAMVHLASDDTDEELYRRLVETACRQVDVLLEQIKEDRVPHGVEQDEANASYYPKQLPNEGVIDWTASAERVSRFIRAHTFPPYPGAILDVSSKELQVRAPVERRIEGSRSRPGEFCFDDGFLVVQCGDCAIRLSEFVIGGTSVVAEEVQDIIGARGRFEVPS